LEQKRLNNIKERKKMITNKEVNLGKTMARLFVLAVIPSFAIQAFVLDPTVSGYNETWGPVLAITNVITGFSLMFVFAITTKLFGDDNNPFVRISGSIAFVTQCVFVMNAFAGPLTSNNEDAYLTTNQVLTAVGGVGPVWAIFLGIFTISVLRSDKVDLLPGWGIGAGYGAAILVSVQGVGSAFGLIPDAANIIILVLGGVILYPATVWALGVSFENSNSN
tara:strand:- start:516 stop:1178 length:663 start_codon:yes stop_codon:yes gene_type:complete